MSCWYTRKVGRQSRHHVGGLNVDTRFQELAFRSAILNCGLTISNAFGSVRIRLSMLNNSPNNYYIVNGCRNTVRNGRCTRDPCVEMVSPMGRCPLVILNACKAVYYWSGYSCVIFSRSTHFVPGIDNSRPWVLCRVRFLHFIYIYLSQTCNELVSAGHYRTM